MARGTARAAVLVLLIPLTIACEGNARRERHDRGLEHAPVERGFVRIECRPETAFVGDALQACWRPPPIEEAHPGMEVTLVFSFNRDGAVMGEPRFTYSSRAASTRVKAAYQRAVVETLNRCNPLRFTPEAGAAIAGHPFAVRFIDGRRIERREKSI